MTEAAKAIGWKLTILDGAGVIANRSAAFGQAIALKPDIIVADNDDATEQKVNIVKAVNAGINVLGWHSNVKPGPMDGVPLFTNISRTRPWSRRSRLLWRSRMRMGRRVSWCSRTPPKRSR